VWRGGRRSVYPARSGPPDGGPPAAGAGRGGRGGGARVRGGGLPGSPVARNALLDLITISPRNQCPRLSPSPPPPGQPYLHAPSFAHPTGLDQAMSIPPNQPNTTSPSPLSSGGSGGTYDTSHNHQNPNIQPHNHQHTTTPSSLPPTHITYKLMGRWSPTPTRLCSWPLGLEQGWSRAEAVLVAVGPTVSRRNYRRSAALAGTTTGVYRDALSVR